MELTQHQQHTTVMQKWHHWVGLGWTVFDFRLGQALAEVGPVFLAHAHLWEWPFVKHKTLP